MRGVAVRRRDSPPGAAGRPGSTLRKSCPFRPSSFQLSSRESRVRSIRRGDSGPAVAEIRSILVGLDLLDTGIGRLRRRRRHRGARLPAEPRPRRRRAGRRRDLGRPRRGPVAARRAYALPLGARRRWSARTSGRCRSDCSRWATTPAAPTRSTAPRTARAVAQFQREVGLTPDGSCGPQTMKALRRLGRKVVGGRPQWLREAEAFRQAGTNLVGKTIVIDPGHGGGDDLGVVVPEGPLRWTEADLVFDLAARLEGRLAAAGMRVHLTRGPSPAAADDRRRASHAGQQPRRRPADLAAPGRPGQRRRPTAWRPTTTAPAAGSPRRWGSGWPTWCSARSWSAPACATAASTPRPGSCCA